MTTTTASSPLPGRLFVLLYGVVSYFIGVAGLACLVAALAWDPLFGFLDPATTAMPAVWNLGLVLAWGVIHSWMARDSFKHLITKVIPEPAERPTYVLIAGVTSVLLVGWWQTVPGSIWVVQQPIFSGLLWALFAFGWVYLLAATFAINHFDLFGLRQVYLNFRDQPRAPLQFVKRAMYRFSRHPIQAGVMVGIWATPHMTATHLLLSIGFTIYIFVGLWFEEQDLIKDIGEPYREYRKEAGMMLPRMRRRG